MSWHHSSHAEGGDSCTRTPRFPDSWVPIDRLSASTQINVCEAAEAVEVIEVAAASFLLKEVPLQNLPIKLSNFLLFGYFKRHWFNQAWPFPLFYLVPPLREQQSYDANFSLRSPSCLSYLLRSHHSGHRRSKETPTEVHIVTLMKVSHMCAFKTTWQLCSRCVKCRAKILRLKQHHRGQRPPNVRGGAGATGDDLGSLMAQSASNYSMSQSSSNHSFASGVSSVSSASSASSVRSVRSFNFDTLTNFQNVNLMNGGGGRNQHHLLTRTTVSIYITTYSFHSQDAPWKEVG